MQLTEKLTITNEDNMALMARYPDNYFELAIVDPPYGIDADLKNSTKKKQSKKSATASKFYGNQVWDKEVPNSTYFNELFRVSKKQVIWGINYFPNISGGGRLYWHKNVTMPTYSQGELAYLSWLSKVDFCEITWHGMIQSDMKNKEIRIHPTQKPVKLYEWLLMNYAKEGDKILDTHLGSGSIAIACHNLKFELTACELDTEYYDNAIQRINNHISQQRLF